MPFSATIIQQRILKALSKLQIEGTESANENGRPCPPRITFGTGVPELLLAAWVDIWPNELKDVIGPLLARHYIQGTALKAWPLPQFIAPGKWSCRAEDGRTVILVWENDPTIAHILPVESTPYMIVNCADPTAKVGGFALWSFSGPQRGTQLHNARIFPFWTKTGFGAAYHITKEGLEFLDGLSSNEAIDDLVTLNQVAPLTGLSKRTLERELKLGKLPQPDVVGGHGRAHKWYWSRLRAPLAKISRKELPERFPGGRILQERSGEPPNHRQNRRQNHGQ